MYHFVPDFDTDVDYVNNNNNNPNSSSSLIHPRKSILGEDEDDNLMELLWEKGQVVVQNQRHNNIIKKPPPPPPSSSSPPKLQPPISHQQQQSDENIFIQEDEMTSWLHYHPLQNDDFCSDLLFEPPPPPPPPPTPSVTKTVETTTQATAASRPPVRNFTNFSRLRGDYIGRGGAESGPKAIVRESTHVNPSAVATPSSAATSESALTTHVDGGSAYNRKGKAVIETGPGIETLGASSKSEIEPEKTNVDERKRKERDVTADETECCSEETKQVRGGGGGSSSSNKRTRAAEVHNLSERKRRDRINERMKALQELIPRCNKSDKASMLDEAIEYMKSLQLQVQMMSMGCGMIPMMYQPGMQQYMAMGMGMNQPLPPPSFMPFPNMLPAAQRPLPTTQTHMGSGSGPPHYPPPPVHPSDQSRIFVPNQQYDPTSVPPPQYPGFMDPYQQFCSLHPTQPPQFQNQATSIQSSRRVSSSKESEVQGNNTTG